MAKKQQQKKRKTGGSFSIEERVALGELLSLAMMCGSSTNKKTQALGVMVVSRAIEIIEGRSKPFVYDNGQILAFVETWKAADPVEFVKRRARRRGEKLGPITVFTDGSIVAEIAEKPSRGRLAAHSRARKKR